MNWRLSVIIACAMLASPAAARSFCDPNMLPPREFDFEPTSKYQVDLWPRDLVPGLCGEAWFPAALYGGCVSTVEGWSFITARNDLPPVELDCVLRHEKAHINGWVHSPLSSNAGRPAK